MSRWKRSYEEWWLWPVRETLGHIAIFLPAIIALLLAILLSWIAPYRNP
jgi:hypothetical protein